MAFRRSREGNTLILTFGVSWLRRWKAKLVVVHLVGHCPFQNWQKALPGGPVIGQSLPHLGSYSVSRISKTTLWTKSTFPVQLLPKLPTLLFSNLYIFIPKILSLRLFLFKFVQYTARNLNPTSHLLFITPTFHNVFWSRDYLQCRLRCWARQCDQQVPLQDSQAPKSEVSNANRP